MKIDPKMLEKAKLQAAEEDKKDREAEAKAAKIWDGVVKKDAEKA